MNILPDYLIEYMPEIEAALEELRLSVLDHAYELLQRLDIDELSTDEIRDKLALYNLKVDNMSGDWLPNGRFYRLYPSIKHHRTRYNAIKAIAKSGGQFEGLWSTSFSRKSEYNFKDILVNRHYELQSNADGYFFISGNIIRNASGGVTSSAAQALTTDILINQALPAGYTYIYIPWPKPMYPDDSSYFYNVNMLMYDRLHYANDCDHIWTLYNKYNDHEVYYCSENSNRNYYCSIDNNGSFQYGSNLDANGKIINWHQFDDSYETDAPFAYTFYDENVPASTRYSWSTGVGTPWRTPYWIDYHYMNDMRRTLPSDTSAGTWPVVESGKYYDENGDEITSTSERSLAVKYELDYKCEELADTRSTFPTGCCLKHRYKTTEPNRLQKFTPNNLVLIIRDFYRLLNERDFVTFLQNTLNIEIKPFIEHSVRIEESAYTDTSPFVFYTDSFNAIGEERSADKYFVHIKLTDESYSEYSGSLYVRLQDNVNNIDLIAEFKNGEWYSEPFDHYPDDISSAVSVYSDTAEFVVNDTLRERFEAGVNNIRYHFILSVYNQSQNRYIDNAEYDYDADIITIDGISMSLDNGNGSFYTNGWIINKYGPVTLYYGETEVSAYYDDLTNVFNIERITCDYSFEYRHQDSIDTNDLTEPYREFSPKMGQYRWDKLFDGDVLHIRDYMCHIKTYKPFWCENTPWFDMLQSNKYSESLTDYDNHSLYYWMNLKQTNNRPSMPIEASSVDLYDIREEINAEIKSILKSNEPPVSEVTFTSYDRPTRGRLDPIYIGYLNVSNDVNKQYENHALNNSHIYIFDDDESDSGNDPVAIEYDPTYSYTITNLNFTHEDYVSAGGMINIIQNQYSKTNCLWDSNSSVSDDIYADFIGDPAKKTLTLRQHDNGNHNIDRVAVNSVVHATCKVVIDQLICDISYDAELLPRDVVLTDSNGVVRFVLNQYVPSIVTAANRDNPIPLDFIGDTPDDDVLLENSINVDDLTVIKYMPASLNCSISMKNITAPSGASKTSAELNVPAYNYITFKKSYVHKLWFNGSHRDAAVADSAQLYNFFGDNNIYKFTENSVGFTFNIIDVYNEKGISLNFGSGEIECWCDGHSYKVGANDIRNKNGARITSAAYVLFTVDVHPGSVRHEESSSINSNLYITLGSRSILYSDIGFAQRTEP
jgi:hypothetical protein